MLESVLETFQIVNTVTYFCFVCSYKTGQWIITVLRSLLNVTINIIKGIQTLANILFEDFRLFWYDICQVIISSSTTLFNITRSVIDVIIVIVDTFKNLIILLFNGIVSVYNGIFSFINYVVDLFAVSITLFKQWLVLLGSGLWFAITILPLFVVYICTTSTYYVGLLLSETFDIMVNIILQLKLNITNVCYFVFDFPIDSLLGLIVGFTIVFAIFKMQIILYRQALLCIRLIRSCIAKVHLTIFKNTARHLEPENASSSDTDESESDANFNKNLCIICQEREKCILLLPCRHLCICAICSLRLPHYNRTCPICRTVVDRTMKVFT